MKIKHLACLTIFAVLSANAFAVDITKGRVLEHKEWTTGAAKLFFSNVNAKKALAFSDKRRRSKKAANDDTSSFDASDDNAPTTFVYAHVQPATGIVGQTIEIKGGNAAHIQNNTDQKQEYHYFSSFCVVNPHPSPSKNDCAYYTDLIELDPAGEANFSEGPVLQVAMDHADGFITTISTSINGYNTQLSSTAKGILTVTKNNN